MSRIITGLAVFLLAACSSTPSLQDTMDKLNQAYAGHNVGDFFLSYGKPAGKVEMKDGGTLYRWVSLEPPEMQQKLVYRSYQTSHGRFAVPEFTPGMSTVPQYCEIGIETNKRNIIRKLSVISDTPGRRSNSLCSEILQR